MTLALQGTVPVIHAVILGNDLDLSAHLVLLNIKVKCVVIM